MINNTNKVQERNGTPGRRISALAPDDLYDALFLVSSTAEIRAVNNRAATISGYASDRLSGMRITELVPGLNPDVLQGLIRRTEPGKFNIVEASLRRADGQKLAVEIVVGRRVSSPELLLLAVRKKTQRSADGSKPEHEQEAVKAATRLARVIFHGTGDAVLVSDLEGNLLDANLRAREIFQRSKSEFSGGMVWDVISGLGRDEVHHVYRMLSDGKHSTLDAYGIRKDQSTFQAEISVGLARMPDRKLLVFSIRSVERRRRMIEMLRMEHNALQNTAGGIVITDTSGRIRFVNRAFLRFWGYSMARDIMGLDLKGLWAEKDRAEQMISAARGGGTWHGELSATGLSGRPFFVQVSAAVNKDTRGRVAGLVFSFTDVTERKRTEEAIRREADAQISQVREQDDFAGRLNIISVPDVMQLIDSTRKSGTLQITRASETVGSVEFLRGQAIRAECGGKRGAQGVYELMARGGEAFFFKQGEPNAQDQEIQESTMSLLLEGSRLMDEVGQTGEVPAAADNIELLQQP
ncbi:MAG: PAS domain S-box protein [Kiritimatiellae bacterium]|nr:PAS domain S-box protein [Kiritimatiellia bacterium]